MPVRPHNSTPLALGFFPTQVHPPEHSLTVVAKGTYRLELEGGHAALVASEAAPLTGDAPLGEATPSSPRYATDFAPWKPRADVLLVGTCHQPGGKPGVVARPALSVGKLRKELVVFGDRRWVEASPGQIVPSDPKPWTSLPLGWESSFGGPAFEANPLGKGFKSDTSGSVALLPALPNIERPGKLLRSPRDQQEPAGFGPLDRSWSTHRAKLGTYDQRWRETRWPYFPDDFDPSFWSSAPADQQLDELQGDELVVLEALVAGRPRVEVELPAVRARCFVKRAAEDVPIEELALRLDTLHIDSDAGIFTLVWRGVLPVANKRFTDVAALLLAVEPLGEAPRSLDHYAADPRWVESAAPAPEAGFEAAPTTAPEPGDAAVEESARRQAQETEKADLDEARKLLREGNADPALLAKLETVTTRDQFLAILDAATGEVDTSALIEKARAGREEAARTLVEQGLPLGDDAPEPEVPAASGKVRLTRAELVLRLGQPGSLEGVDLSGVDLSGLDFTDRDLTGASLHRATLSGARFVGATLKGADLSFTDGAASGAHAPVDLSGANLAEAKVTEARLSGAKLDAADLSGAGATQVDLREATLKAAKLTRATLDRAHLESADMAGANAEGASLRGVVAGSVVLRGADLSRALLDEAELTGANLDGAELARASLRNARLAGASLSKATLRGADMTGAMLERAALGEADLSRARLDGARFDHATLVDALFEGARGVGVSMQQATLTGLRAARADLRQARLEKTVANGSIWIGAALPGARFDEAELVRACFDESQLEGAVFELAVMKQASFTRSSLRGARLTRVDLFRGVLEGADLTDADVRGSNLFECELLEAVTENTRFEQTNLKRTKLSRAEPS
ncbi:MAG: DUF2169 domain-containing protein [Myxococcales bacterium]|nr:DUF2169 domain-containing protein [Myxococcales bacterium]